MSEHKICVECGRFGDRHTSECTKRPSENELFEAWYTQHNHVFLQGDSKREIMRKGWMARAELIK